jgi:hypothetical protein
VAGDQNAAATGSSVSVQMTLSAASGPYALLAPAALTRAVRAAVEPPCNASRTSASTWVNAGGGQDAGQRRGQESVRLVQGHAVDLPDG